MLVRNQKGLSAVELARCEMVWCVLIDAQDEKFRVEPSLDVSHATTDFTVTVYDERTNTVRVGANVLPGLGSEACERLSLTACLAHELAHAQRFFAGMRRSFDFPDSLLDEAETSLWAAHLVPLLDSEVEDLIDDSRSRLAHWLTTKRFSP